MTILDAKNVLFEFFLEKDVFELEYCDKISITGVEKDLKTAIFKSALEEMERDGFTRQVSPGVWVLSMSLNLYKQNIEIPGEAANYIGNIISKCDEVLKVENRPINKMNISLNDILDCFSVLEQLILASDKIKEVFKP